MAQPEIAGKIAQTRLRQRLFTVDGKLGYLFEDKRTAVELESDIWLKVSQEYDRDVVSATRLIKIASIAYVPVVIVSLVILVNVSFLEELSKRADKAGWPGLVMLLLLLLWLPLSAIAISAYKVHKAVRRLEAQLVDLPGISPPGNRPVLHQNLRILVILLVGPVLIINAIGTLFPGVFRNTPLTNAHLGWTDVLAVIVMLAWYYTRPRHDR